METKNSTCVVSDRNVGAVIGMLLFDNLLMAVCVALPCAFGGYHIVRTLIQRLPDANDQTLEQIGNNLLP